MPGEEIHMPSNPRDAATEEIWKHLARQEAWDAEARDAEGDPDLDEVVPGDSGHLGPQLSPDAIRVLEEYFDELDERPDGSTAEPVDGSE